MHKITTRSLPILLACLMSVSTMGCGGSSSSSDGGVGSLNLSITDAPVDNAAALWLTLTHVTLNGVEGSSDQGPFEIPEDRQAVNLMEYTGNANAVLVQDVAVPAGSYKLRLDVDLTFTASEQKSWIAFAADADECSEPLPDGAVWSPGEETCRYPLTIPSGEQSGFKPKGEILVTAGGVSDFTVEFDLRRNVVNPSNPNDVGYKLKPTGLRLVDETEAGSIAGAVVLEDGCNPESARVYLYDRTGEEGAFVPDDIHDGNGTYVTSVALTTETVDDVTDYHYLIGFVPVGGAYAVALTCADSDDPELDEEVFPFSLQADGIVVTVSNETTQDLPSE